MTKCSICGGTNVQTLTWVNVNTNEVGDLGASQSQDEQDNWCIDCMEHCSLVD